MAVANDHPVTKKLIDLAEKMIGELLGIFLSIQPGLGMKVQNLAKRPSVVKKNAGVCDQVQLQRHT